MTFTISDDMKKALYGIVCSLLLWAVKDHVEETRASRTRVTVLETKMDQVLGQLKYYQGNPVTITGKPAIPPTPEAK